MPLKPDCLDILKRYSRLPITRYEKGLELQIENEKLRQEKEQIELEREKFRQENEELRKKLLEKENLLNEKKSYATHMTIINKHA